jgi:hypothetical protein
VDCGDRNPTAEWLARQITEAFPWDSAAKYLVRDKDRAFGAAFKARVRAMGIRDRRTSFRSAETAQEIWNGILHWHDAGGEPLRAAT